MTAVAEVRALLALRVAAARGRARRRAALGAVLVPAVVVAAVAAGMTAPRGELLEEFTLLVPSAFAFFVVGAVLAATTGGGRRLLPPEQAVAFPLSPAGDHLGALLLLPLNLSWLVQAVFLVGLTAWAVGPAAGAPVALVLTLLWIVATSVVAQAVGWAAEIARTTRRGTWLLRGLWAAAALAVLLVTLSGNITGVLDEAPTTGLVVAVLVSGAGDVGVAVVPALVLAGAAVVAFGVGARLAGVLQRRPARSQVLAESAPRPRRRDPSSPLRAALRIDRAGVWRSPPLRRGIVALGAVPGAAAAASGLEWPMIALLPGLVASGAALLFGVNAFCLDGPGALWRETLPGPARVALVARFLVVAEVCAAGGLIALAAAAVRTPAPPTAQEALAVTGALLVTTAQVVARCVRWSVDHPYAADLRDARDQPAPPAAMAGYSARLAVGTTFTGLLFVFLAAQGEPVTTSAVVVALVALAGGRVAAVARRWDDPAVRARVLGTVAGARA